ncbi:MAG: cation:proton antiporter [Acidimicrobiia bacterium]|nr:cation:proton antiporter [Acidimicrobiia bacterium]
MRGLFLLELGAVLVGLTVLARIAGRFSFSPIPLYLGLGLIVGEHGLFPIEVSKEFIDVGAELGAILLLFLLGVEYSVSELIAGAKKAYVSGGVDLLLNFTPGFVVGWALGWSTAAAFLLGGVTYISSSGIAAKLMRDLGWLGNRETPAVLSVLVIEDLVMAVYLAVAATLVFGAGGSGAFVSVLAATGLVAVVLFAAGRYGTQVSRLVFGQTDESVLLGLLGVVLTVAGLAEQVQVSAAVGAFLVGLAVSDEAARRAGQLLGPLRDLFGATFFLFFGLQVDPGEIPAVLVPAVVLIVVVGITKLVTGWVAARRFGSGPGGRRRAGALLVARGEFSIIIAEIGVEAGLEPELAPLATAVVLGLATAGPLAVQFAAIADRRRRSGAAPPGGTT